MGQFNMSIFHLAIPTHNLSLAKKFYVETLGAEIGREYDDYVIFNFFGHQVVAHLNSEGIAKDVSMYPRHFGIIFENEECFQSIYFKAKTANAKFFEELFERFHGRPAWHWTFFLVDPSNNLIEFKYYKQKRSVFDKV